MNKADPPRPPPYLILVKHALPQVAPEVPARDWQLAPEGRISCAPLADRLAAYRPAVVVTSQEPKAAETGRLVAARLDLPCESAADLHEHDRHAAGYLDKPAFEAAMRAFFARPAQQVFGSETADQARARFQQAAGAVLGRYRELTVVIVAHGTVITLFVAAALGIAPFPFWQRLGLPSFIVLARPTLEPVALVENVS